MNDSAEKLEAALTKLAGIETLLEGLIEKRTEESCALVVINAVIDSAFGDIEAVAVSMKEKTEAGQ